MINFLKSLFKSFVPMTHEEYRNWYLSESYDLIDLERRMKELDRPNSKYFL